MHNKTFNKVKMQTKALYVGCLAVLHPEQPGIALHTTAVGATCRKCASLCPCFPFKLHIQSNLTHYIRYHDLSSHLCTQLQAASPGRARPLTTPRLLTPISSSATNPLATSTQPRSAHIMRYKTDQQQGQEQNDTSNGPGANSLSNSMLSKVVGDQQQQQQVSVQLSADDVMADMCTMLGGISKE